MTKPQTDFFDTKAARDKNRAKLALILLVPQEKRSAEQTTEETALKEQYPKLLEDYTAANVALRAEQEKGVATVLDSEGRAFQELSRRASLGVIVAKTVSHGQTEGAEAEIQQALGLAGNQVPLAMLETRAVTPAPTDVGQTQSPIVPGVFAQSAAAFLGVDMPTVGTGDAVYAVLTKNAEVKTPAENAAAAETTGSFSADVLSPARLQASFFYSREDRARFSGMDDALRENLSMALGDGLDKQIIQGTNGLLTATNLANNNVSAVTDFAAYLSNFGYSRVDGTYAGMAGDLRSVVGGGTYAHMGSSYRGNNADYNAVDALTRITGGIRVSSHVPAVSGSKQNSVVRLGNRRDMVAAIWEGITLIPDEITKAGDGQIVITAVMLHAVKIIRKGGFHKQQSQHS